MGWAAIAMQAAQGVVGAVGAEQSASAQATSARYQAAVADNNAAVARNNALMATRIGEQKSMQQELKNRGQLGAIIAQQAGNGVDVNTGSAKDVQTSARVLGRQDTMTIRSDAAREAYGYETEAQNFKAQSKLLKKSAKDARSAGDVAALSSLLGGAASAAGSYSSAYGGGDMKAPTPLSTGANVLDTDYWAPNDTGSIY